MVPVVLLKLRCEEGHVSNHNLGNTLEDVSPLTNLSQCLLICQSLLSGGPQEVGGSVKNQEDNILDLLESNLGVIHENKVAKVLCSQACHSTTCWWWHGRRANLAGLNNSVVLLIDLIRQSKLRGPPFELVQGHVIMLHMKLVEFQVLTESLVQPGESWSNGPGAVTV